MKSNELRIGNVVNFTFMGLTEQHRVCAIDLNTIKTNKDSYQIEMVSGIPLTPEWLLKFGFEHEIGDYFHVGDHYFALKLLKGKFLFDKFWHVEIKYVHQLQNLYFALTSNELEIKEG